MIASTSRAMGFFGPMTLISEPESAAVPPASDREPAFLVRARRILGGDIRPEDYLPVTPEVQRRVDLFMDWARSRAQGQPPPLGCMTSRTGRPNGQRIGPSQDRAADQA